MQYWSLDHLVWICEGVIVLCFWKTHSCSTSLQTARRGNGYQSFSSLVIRGGLGEVGRRGGGGSIPDIAQKLRRKLRNKNNKVMYAKSSGLPVGA